MADNIEIIRYKDHSFCLGAALNILRRSHIYRRMKLGGVVDMLMGQIKRNHFCFLVKDNTIIGYCGWALCQPSIAKLWITEKYLPNYDECLVGSAVVIATLYCEDKQGLYDLKSLFKKTYPNNNIFGMRNYTNHKRSVIFRVNDKKTAC